MQISPVAHLTDHRLCAFWTPGFTARPPNLGSASCIPIFQVLNRSITGTSRCILDRSARSYYRTFFIAVACAKHGTNSVVPTK